jgi:hypothetical protein
MQATNCTWICPKCETTNISTTFSNCSGTLDLSNSFEVLDKENLTTLEVRRPKQFTDKITYLSININGIRGKN